MPRFFRRSSTDENTTTSNEGSKINVKKIATSTAIVVAGLAVALFIGLQIFTMSNNIATRWPEIQFAFEKPSLVKTVRVNYQTQQQKLEDSFVKNNQASSEDEIANRVADQIVHKVGLK